VIRRFAAASAAILVFSELCACSHTPVVVCEPTSRYAAAATDGPVRIPDDLNPPDETESLRLPPDTGPTAKLTTPCLETPPGFYADGAQNNPRGGQGQRRNGAPAASPRKAAPPPAAASAPTSVPSPGPEPPPPVAAPAPPATNGPLPGGDREITN
jgi:hypothetical protein